MDIRTVDPFDDAALAAWHRTVVAADRHGREEAATPWALAEVRADQQAGQDDSIKRLYSGVVDGKVVVGGEFDASLLDSLDHARVAVYTAPEHRRRGHGSAMLEHLEQVASEHGRTVLNAEAAWPYDAPADGRGNESADFLTHRGFKFGLGDIARVLDLPVDQGLLDRLAADVAPAHAAYTLRSWVGPVPDDLIASHVELDALLMVEAPTGELEREPEKADVEAFRRHENVVRLQGRTKYTTVAVDEEGTVVAFTDIVTTSHQPDLAFQWGTLVRRNDRGHRLGLAVKVANLLSFQREQDRARHLRTWNAEVNRHMVAVNDLLGFRPLERLGEFQMRLPGPTEERGRSASRPG